MFKNKAINWVNREDAKKLDREPFSSLPLRTRTGLFILALSFVIGYGVPLITLIIAWLNKDIITGVVNSLLFYGFSWGLGIFGLAMAGKDVLKYPVYFSAKFAKLLFPDFFSQNQ